MSGGHAESGASYAGWACRDQDISRVESWVRSRREMRRVRIVGPGYRPNPDYCAHYHVYVVTDNHPSIRDRMVKPDLCSIPKCNLRPHKDGDHSRSRQGPPEEQSLWDRSLMLLDMYELAEHWWDERDEEETG